MNHTNIYWAIVVVMGIIAIVAWSLVRINKDEKDDE